MPSYTNLTAKQYKRPKWTHDTRGNKLDTRRFGGVRKCQELLASQPNLTNSTNCVGCNDCDGCYECVNCSHCTNCSGLKDRAHESDERKWMPSLAKIRKSLAQHNN